MDVPLAHRLYSKVERTTKDISNQFHPYDFFSASKMSFHERTPYFVQCQLTKLRKISKHRPGCANSEISCQDLAWPSFPLFSGARCENTSCQNENNAPISLKRKSCSSVKETLDEGYEDDEKTSNSSVLAAFFSPTYYNTS